MKTKTAAFSLLLLVALADPCFAEPGIKVTGIKEGKILESGQEINLKIEAVDGFDIKEGELIATHFGRRTFTELPVTFILNAPTKIPEMWIEVRVWPKTGDRAYKGMHLEVVGAGKREDILAVERLSREYFGVDKGTVVYRKEVGPSEVFGFKVESSLYKLYSSALAINHAKRILAAVSKDKPMSSATFLIRDQDSFNKFVKSLSLRISEKDHFLKVAGVFVNLVYSPDAVILKPSNSRGHEGEAVKVFLDNPFDKDIGDFSPERTTKWPSRSDLYPSFSFKQDVAELEFYTTTRDHLLVFWTVGMKDDGDVVYSRQVDKGIFHPLE